MVPFMRFLTLATFLTPFCIAAEDPAKAETYYPLKPGSRWVYRFRDGQTETEQTVRVAGREKAGDATLTRVEVIAREPRTGKEFERYTERIGVSAEGVAYHTSSGEKLAAPNLRLKFPLREKATWKDEVTLAGKTARQLYTVGKEAGVVVAAGRFRAMPVTCETEVNRWTITVTSWYAPGV